jgi:hypothetical protein
MYIANKTGGKIFWRTFNAGDTVRMFGLAEGLLEKDDYTTWWAGSRTDKVQLEVKKESLTGSFISEASTGTLYGMDAEVIVSPSGAKSVSYETTS